jgi:hypothetical protein
MKVYLVYECWEYEYKTVKAIFDNKVDAEIYESNLNQSFSDHHKTFLYTEIEEFTMGITK